ncbi:hypothetical protein CYLTODRAFT_492234 [Cylindrobasidium torrendii FP15055 ss-10]|uniref:Uncharacterized protein n=1 Tax=Cylindrobasidium torrendii FP15055 ss-10 TaxID=1314674 RepID=A0A0D7B7L6_9AGAR|nr:hypothetical protein CYLTODRAFT_492234 [Cylindrobasidium torrendii FP15055 ss-10]
MTMTVIYTEDCISLSPLFASTLSAKKLVDPGQNRIICTLEGATGLNIGEMITKMDQPINLLHLASKPVVQAFALSLLAFRPPPHTIALLQELYEHNARCPMSERRRFDEVPELRQDCEYTLQMFPGFQKDIFLKHPETGAITTHQHPYSDLPCFRLLTAHPTLVSVPAARQVTVFPWSWPVQDPLSVLSYQLTKIDWPPQTSQNIERQREIWREMQREKQREFRCQKRARRANVALMDPRAA